MHIPDEILLAASSGALPMWAFRDWLEDNGDAAGAEVVNYLAKDVAILRAYTVNPVIRASLMSCHKAGASPAVGMLLALFNMASAHADMMERWAEMVRANPNPLPPYSLAALVKPGTL